MAIKNRLFLLFFVFVFVAVAVNPVSAATTSVRLNETEDFVDATSNLHLETPDIGTHSVFGDLQDYGANYDQMQEADTGAAGNDVEQFVQAQTNAGTPTDIGTHAGGGFAEMQDKDGTFDLLTEANTGGAGIDETDYVDGDAASYTDWGYYGTTPFLQQGTGDANYITAEKAGGVVEWYTFGDTSETGTDFDITLYVYFGGGGSGPWDGNDDCGWEIDTTGDGTAEYSGTFTNPTSTEMSAILVTGTGTVTEYNNARLSLNCIGSGKHNDGDVDQARIRIERAGGDVFDMDLEVGWTTADYDETTGEELCIFGGTMATELLRVDVWTGTWTNLDTDIVAGWNNISVSAYLTDATFEIRFTDTTNDAVVADDWEIEGVLLHVWTDATTNYELDLEIGWSAVDNNENNEYLCIYPVTGGGWPAEAIKVDIWDGAWTNLFADLTPDQWNNITISSYLTGAAVEVRFLGGTETGDTTQDTFEIDAVLIHTWSLAYTRTDYESLVIADTYYYERGVTEAYYDAMVIADAVYTEVDFARTYFEEVIIAGTEYTASDFARLFNEAVQIAEDVIRNVSYAVLFFESVIVAVGIALTKVAQQFLYEELIVGTQDVILTGTFNRIFSEQIIIAPTLYNAVEWARAFYEELIIVDHVYPAKAFTKYLFESVVIGTGTVVLTADFSRLFSESLVIAESNTNTASYARAFYEEVVLNETCYPDKNPGGTAYQKFLFDELIIADMVYPAREAFKTMFEELIVADVAYNSKQAAQTLYESIILGTGAVALTVEWSRIFNESIVIADMAYPARAVSKTMFEELIVADVVYRTKQAVKNLYESIVIGTGTISNAVSWSRIFNESIIIAESIVNSAGRLVTLFEEIIIADTIYTVSGIDYFKYIFEEIIIAEVIDNSWLSHYYGYESVVFVETYSSVGGTPYVAGGIPDLPTLPDGTTTTRRIVGVFIPTIEMFLVVFGAILVLGIAQKAKQNKSDSIAGWGNRHVKGKIDKAKSAAEWLEEMFE